MEYYLKTRLDGDIAVTFNFHENKDFMNKNLYKFIWVQKGNLTIEIDHVIIQLCEDEIISLTPLHYIEIKEVNGTYLTLLFNSNFYCIYGHDSEVSCNGFLFNGSSNIMILKLLPAQSATLHSISDIFINECTIKDDLQEEMLRIVLKRFIITCTRIAREKFAISRQNMKSFETIRQYYVLVDNHFKEKKQVKDYADILCRSPKTLSNLFSEYGLPTPLKIIHERIGAEAKRLLLYTNKSAKEIADILGFEDLATFSRFFKKMTKESISEYRKREKQEVLLTQSVK